MAVRSACITASWLTHKLHCQYPDDILELIDEASNESELCAEYSSQAAARLLPLAHYGIELLEFDNRSLEEELRQISEGDLLRRQVGVISSGASFSFPRARSASLVPAPQMRQTSGEQIELAAFTRTEVARRRVTASSSPGRASFAKGFSRLAVEFRQRKSCEMKWPLSH